MCKPHIWKNSFSGVTAGKALNHIVDLRDQIYLWMEWFDLMDCLYFYSLPEKENI